MSTGAIARKRGAERARTDYRARLIDPVLLAGRPAHRRAARWATCASQPRGRAHAAAAAARERRRENWRRVALLRRLRLLRGSLLPSVRHVVLREKQTSASCKHGPWRGRGRGAAGGGERRTSACSTARSVAEDGASSPSFASVCGGCNARRVEPCRRGERGGASGAGAGRLGAHRAARSSASAGIPRHRGLGTPRDS